MEFKISKVNLPNRHSFVKSLSKEGISMKRQTCIYLTTLTSAMFIASGASLASQVKTQEKAEVEKKVNNENDLFKKAQAEAKLQGNLCIKTSEGFVTKSLLGHIMHAVLNPQTDQFSTTDVFRFEDETFTHLGDVTQMPKDALKEAAEGNYVYTNFYTMKKTRLSNEFDEAVGAIIIGTKNEEVVSQLRIASMVSLIQEYKKAASGPKESATSAKDAQEKKS